MSDEDRRKAMQEIIGQAAEGVPSAMQKEEAFYTILAAAVVADHEVQEVETEEREALVHRSRLLQKLRKEKPTELEKMRQQVNARLENMDRLASYVRDAADSLKDDQEMAYSVFAHAADIVFADSKFVAKEGEFLMQLAEGLRLSTDDMRQIMQFITKKNKH
jgi:tellurite resistance protein